MKKYYKNLPGQPRVLGKLQGKGDIAIFWVTISSVILIFVHSLVYQGLQFPGVDGKICIEKNNGAPKRTMLALGEALKSVKIGSSSCYGAVTR